MRRCKSCADACEARRCDRCGTSRNRERWCSSHDGQHGSRGRHHWSDTVPTRGHIPLSFSSGLAHVSILSDDSARADGVAVVEYKAVGMLLHTVCRTRERIRAGLPRQSVLRPASAL